MPTIVVRHLTGARANQVDQFPTAVVKEVIVGRDAAAQVRFDADRDDLVSRQHVKIVRDPKDLMGFQLVDLESRNGTFLNRQRVTGTVRLNHFDIVQLGAGGPEFRFEIDPPPAVAAQPAREAAAGSSGMKATREMSSPLQAGRTPASRPVGRATVERMLDDVFGRVYKENKKSTSMGIMAIVAIVLIGGAIAYYIRQSGIEQKAILERDMGSLQRLNDELRTNPGAVNSMNEQIARLEAELKQSDQRQQAAVESLLKEIKLRAREAKVGLTAPRAASGQKGAGASTPAGTKPAVSPGAAPVDLSGASYDTLMDQAADRFQRGLTVGALDLVRIAIKKEPGRWEGYEFAGELAEKMEDYAGATSWFEQALQKAPSDSSRQDIQSKLDAMKQKLTGK